MRHQTTGYDSLVIPRMKGKRRDVRRKLAQRSKVSGERVVDRVSERAFNLLIELPLVVAGIYFLIAG